MKLEIVQHGDGTTTIEGTRYVNDLFKELGCGFPKMVGQVLKVEEKPDKTVTVSRLHHWEVGQERELLREFATQLLQEWTMQKYWDGEPCERATNPEVLVEAFLARELK